MRYLTDRKEDGTVDVNLDEIASLIYADTLTPEFIIEKLSERLAYYEDLEKAGRIKVSEPYQDKRCIACKNFKRIDGKKLGICTAMPHKDRYGKVVGEINYVYQSHKACLKEFSPINGSE